MNDRIPNPQRAIKMLCWSPLEPKSTALRSQWAEYDDEIVRPSIPKVSCESMLPGLWQGIVISLNGPNGTWLNPRFAAS